jgi:hypothetical protein
MIRLCKRCAAVGKLLVSAIISMALMNGIAAAQNPAPYIDQISADSIIAGSGDFVIDVFGIQFDPNSVVLWNGESRNTTFYSAGYLQVEIPASDVAFAGDAVITVMNSDGQVSNVMPVFISDLLPSPLLTSISPSVLTAGGTDTAIAIYGSGFTNQSIVLVNGVAQPTTYIDSGTLSSTISANDITVPTSLSISVQASSTGNAISQPLAVTIAPFASVFFPQIAVGGGYTTTITIVNRGSKSASGQLTLTDPTGQPLTVAASSAGNSQGMNSVFTVSVPPEGEDVIALDATDGVAAVKNGWARIDSDNNDLTGVAEIRFTQASMPVSIADIPPGQFLYWCPARVSGSKTT